MDVHISFQDTNCIYLGLYPEVELVDHMVIPFFWPHPQHVEVPGLGIELEPQQWLEPQPWECRTLKPWAIREFLVILFVIFEELPYLFFKDIFYKYCPIVFWLPLFLMRSPLSLMSVCIIRLYLYPAHNVTCSLAASRLSLFLGGGGPRYVPKYNFLHNFPAWVCWIWGTYMVVFHQIGENFTSIQIFLFFLFHFPFSSRIPIKVYNSACYVSQFRFFHLYSFSSLSLFLSALQTISMVLYSGSLILFSAISNMIFFNISTSPILHGVCLSPSSFVVPTACRNFWARDRTRHIVTTPNP